MTLPLHSIQIAGTLAEAAGGPPRTIVALSDSLVRAGVAVDVVADDASPMLPVPAGVGTRIVSRFSDFPDAVGAALAARPGHAAILHDNGIWSGANRAAMAAARRHRLRYVVSPHGMLEPWAMAHHRGRKQIAWHVYQHRALAGAVGLLATAEQERAAIRALFPRLPIATIANGVDVPAKLAARPLRQSGDPATLLFMSRLHPKKNLIGLLDAWARLAAVPALAHWTLAISGPDEGGHRAEVEAHARKLGVEARVRITGPVAETGKAEAFAACDLFVLPSFSENFGIVVTEALAHGVPVVATIGAPWAELPARGCGWWVAPTPEALARALGEAMRLPSGERAAMGARGRDWVSRTFGWAGIAEQTRDFYAWLLHGGRRPEFVDA